jgi:dihydroorotate dehydrogenase (fumarate)
MTSALYKHGIQHIRDTLNNLEQWLTEHGYDSLDDMRGRLCVYSGTNAAAFERANYMKVLKSY